MNPARSGLIWMSSLFITVVLATSGCATKKYVRQQVDPVDQRVASNTALAQQANATASKAVQMAQANQSAISANLSEIEKVSNAMNYALIEKTDVMFGFNKSDLDDNAIMVLNLIIQKAQAAPQVVVELTGFTDTIGPKQYNLMLSRRRAEAVQRYLVRSNIPSRCIHIVGLGKERVPAALAVSLRAADANASLRDIQRLARRVHILVYSADWPQNEAARATP